MKCTTCKEQAVISLPRHNVKFCSTHFKEYVVRQTEKAIHDFKMLDKSEKIMVCVSGGKDSLALWYILHQLGYDTTGMYINLGIGEYSERSHQKVLKFIEKFGLKSIVVSLADKGQAIEPLAKKSRRPNCSVCGSIKRYYFNKVAYDEGFDVIATGHNLDDEAGRLMGNLLHWQRGHLAKQHPVLAPEGPMLKRKVKPLVRLTEKEMAAFAFLSGIDYILEECPFSKGASSIPIKEALNLIEDQSPNTKYFFYHQYLNNKDAFALPEETLEERKLESTCKICGFVSFNDVCSFCRLVGNGK